MYKMHNTAAKSRTVPLFILPYKNSLMLITFCSHCNAHEQKGIIFIK